MAGSETASPSAETWPQEHLEAVAACPACGHPERTQAYGGLRDRLFPAPGAWSLWRCGGCRSLYLDPRPDRATIGRAYERYVTHGPPPAAPPRRGLAGAVRERLLNGHLNVRYGYELRPASRLGAAVVPLIPRMAPQVDRWIRHLHPTGSLPRVLDFGCGNGEFLLRMRDLGWEAHGIDFDETAVGEARAAGLSVRVGTLADLDPAEQRFDAITLGHVIEHLHDPVAELARAHELLRPGGMIWLATPNVAALGHRLFRDSWFALDPPRHLVLFNEGSLSGALRRAGFGQVEVLRPGPGARWLFPPSLAIRRGLDPLGADPLGTAPELTRGLRARAHAAELVAWRRPAVAEELLVAGWKTE